MEGRVKMVNSRGFGFIQTEKNIDFFLHMSYYQGDWKELVQLFICGEIIILEFDIDRDAPRGPRAINVKFKSSYRSSDDAGSSKES